MGSLVEEAMKILVATIAAVTLLASSAGVNAKNPSKAHKHYARAKGNSRHMARDHRFNPAYPDTSGWYPHDSSQLVVGSTAWWDQMLREGRLNQGGGRN
jgi:hypothetical protein